MSEACASPRCTLVGILDDGWAGLSDLARQRLQDAGLVLGVRRTLALVADRVSGETRALDDALRQLPDWIRAAWRSGQPVAVLATGDPLCHGLGAWLIDRLGGDRLEILPAPSTLQLACARLGKPWPDWRILSCHGTDSGDWPFGATPDHGLYPLLRALDEHPRLIVFTSPANDPARLARALLTAGHGDEVRLTVAVRLAGPDERILPDLSLETAAELRVPAPNLVLIERSGSRPESEPLFGLADAGYAQRQPRDGLITRLEVRAVALARLGLRADSQVWDIGAGSGAVGLEAARLARRGHVWAIEKNPADAANARANARRLRATNYTLIEGRAPAGLATWPAPDAAFIGGSGGALEPILDRVLDRLRPGGRLVMNLVTLEHLAAATRFLTHAGVCWEVTQLQIARSQPIRDLQRLVGLNPVWMVSAARRAADCEDPAP